MIKKLSPDTIAQIAAGQVVDRPYSIVKELIENSLDAHAKHISIDLKKAGIENVKISDDGEGIRKSDLKHVFTRYATSKISSSDDLLTIRTLGFRGEALASINAISHTTLLTKHISEKSGYKLTKSEKKIVIEPAPATTGTVVNISSLFTHMPARKKFLKTPKTELSHIIQTVGNYILANETVGFVLKNNGKIIFSVHPTDTLKTRLSYVFGKDISQHLLPMSVQFEKVHIKGFIGTPQVAGRSGLLQYLFVNKRPAKNSTIYRAIKDKYSKYIDPRLICAFVLYVDTDPRTVDVNISPKKDEAAFVYENSIEKMLEKYMDRFIKKHDLTYQGLLMNKRLSDSSLAKHLVQSSPWTYDKKKQRINSAFIINDLYFSVLTDNGLFLVDQHAAHERILYEHYLKSFNDKKKPVKLKKPLIFSVPPSQHDQAENMASFFAQGGFIYESFGKNDFKLSHIPEIFEERDLKTLILSLIQQIETKTTDVQTIQTIANISCRYAIKKGEKVNPTQAIALFKKLLTCDNCYVCPHGRPTHVRISIQEMDAFFRRTGQH